MDHLSPDNFKAALMRPMLHVRDQLASGTVGTTMAALTDNLQPLQTVMFNGIAGATLSANQIGLDAGTYLADLRAHYNPLARIWLYDTTGAAIVVEGMTNTPPGGTGSSAVSARGIFTLSVRSLLEMRVYVFNGPISGYPAYLSSPEVYADVLIERLA